MCVQVPAAPGARRRFGCAQRAESVCHWAPPDCARRLHPKRCGRHPLPAQVWGDRGLQGGCWGFCPEPGWSSTLQGCARGWVVLPAVGAAGGRSPGAGCARAPRPCFLSGRISCFRLWGLLRSHPGWGVPGQGVGPQRCGLLPRAGRCRSRCWPWRWGEGRGSRQWGAQIAPHRKHLVALPVRSPSPQGWLMA